MFRGLWRARQVWKQSVEADKKRPNLKRSKQELEFLPAALEILDTPASPLPRVTIILICFIVVFAIGWAIIGKVDTVAVAQGKIIPGGRTKVIQPPEAGVVRAIHVRDGQPVKKGDVLIEFDPTETGADRDRFARELDAARMDVARLSALSIEKGDPTKRFTPPADADPRLVRAARALLRQTWYAQRAKLAAVDADIRKEQAKRAKVAAQIAKLRRIIPLLSRRTGNRRLLANKGYGTRTSLMQLEQELATMVGDLRIAQQEYAEISRAVDALKSRRTEMIAATRAATHEELVKALRSVAALEQELAKAQSKFKHLKLYAPVDGVVQQLQVHTVGAVVKPADALMVVVPGGAVLEIEAKVLNKDIGFVKAGQAVEIKVESFPFTRYGLIDGEVVTISADAIQDEKLGPVYNARIRMKTKRILVGSNWVNLGPGMAVTAEVKTGDRRVIQYFLAPFLRYQAESLRER